MEHMQQKNALSANAQDVIEMEKSLDATEKQWNILRELLIGPGNAKENYSNFFRTLENQL